MPPSSLIPHMGVSPYRVLCAALLVLCSGASSVQRQTYPELDLGRTKGEVRYTKVDVPAGCEGVVVTVAVNNGCNAVNTFISANRIPQPDIGVWDARGPQLEGMGSINGTEVFTLQHPTPKSAALYVALQATKKSRSCAVLVSAAITLPANFTDINSTIPIEITPDANNVHSYIGVCPEITVLRGVAFVAINFDVSGATEDECDAEQCIFTSVHPHAEGTIFQFVVRNISASSSTLFHITEGSSSQCTLRVSTAHTTFNGLPPFYSASQADGTLTPEGVLVPMNIPHDQTGTRWVLMIANVGSKVPLEYTIYHPIYRLSEVLIVTVDGIHDETQKPLLSETENGTVVLGGLRKVYLQFPRGGSYYVKVSGVGGFASLVLESLDVRTFDDDGREGGCPDACNGVGDCELTQIAGGSFYESCHCNRPYMGYNCTEFIDGTQYPPRFYALTFSNAAFLPVIVLCLFKVKAYVEGMVYLLNMVASVLYHMCDEDVAHLCLFDYDTMQFMDFFVSFSSMWFTVLYLARLRHIQLRETLQVQGVMMLALIALQFRSNNSAVIIPLGVAGVVALYQWCVHCGRAGTALEYIVAVSPLHRHFIPPSGGATNHHDDSSDDESIAADSTLAARTELRQKAPSWWRRLWYGTCCPVIARRGVSLWASPWFSYPFFVVGVLLATAGIVDISVFETDENYPTSHTLWHVMIGLSPAFLIWSAQKHRPVDKSDFLL